MHKAPLELSDHVSRICPRSEDNCRDDHCEQDCVKGVCKGSHCSSPNITAGAIAELMIEYCAVWSGIS